MTLVGQTVLVTGANGFIGGALALRLLAEGVIVRGLVRSAEKGAWIARQGAQVVVADVRDVASLRPAVVGCAFVFDVAAAMGNSSPALSYDVNVTGTLNLARAAHELGVQRLIHVGTIAAYGYRNGPVIAEETPLRPRGEAYGINKALGEQQLWEYAASVGLPVTGIRPGMVYGPRSGFWTGAMFRLVRRPPGVLIGSPTASCPAIFIDDVVDLLVTVATHPRAAAQMFNATPDPAPTWREFFGAYAAMAGHHRFVRVPLPLARTLAGVGEAGLRLRGEPQPLVDMVTAFFSDGRSYSMAKAADLLGWRPRVSLAEGMVQAEAWLRETGRLD
ncbi:MAG: NAD(P)-dependent oxidoreductase [Anaerolineae bacterium]|nr:NAD(P)-dependent oxidoreductase [Anaerolineae bacterium]